MLCTPGRPCAEPLQAPAWWLTDRRCSSQVKKAQQLVQVVRPHCSCCTCYCSCNTLACSASVSLVKGSAHRAGLLCNQVLRAQEAAKAQEELAAAEFDGYSSDETVRVVMSGNQEPKSVDITDEAIALGAEVRAALHRVAAEAGSLSTSEDNFAASTQASKTPVLSEPRLKAGRQE